MSKLTQDKKRKILEIYDQELEYKATAKKAGVCEATVRNVVEERRRTMSEGSGTTMNTSPSPEAISSGITVISRGQTIKAATGGDHGDYYNNKNTTNSKCLSGGSTMNLSMNASVQEEDDNSNINGDIDIQRHIESKFKHLIGIIFKGSVAGQTPEYIAATNRFDLDTVNYYYNLFAKIRNCDSAQIQKRLLELSAADIIPRFQRYKVSFDHKGYLTIDETISFVQEVVHEEVSRMLGRFFGDANYKLPNGLYRVICPNCNRLSGIIQSPPMGIAPLCGSCYSRFNRMHGGTG
jgi:hypothetical protein